jgi:CheY-like chemotaxis protein
MPDSVERPRGSRLDPQTGGERKSILIADDSNDVRDVIRLFLERAGFYVCGEAADGIDAIEKARQLKPDLIVMDLAMPGMNGVEATGAIAGLLPGIPIVVITMYGEVLGKSLTSAAGAKAVIPKAEGMSKLIECVQGLLEPS